MKLQLTPAFDSTGVPILLVMRTGAAARYLGLRIVRFRQLVRQGVIVARRHAGSKHPVFRRYDLDGYAASLEVVGSVTAPVFFLHDK
jgi:hypothetical protein